MKAEYLVGFSQIELKYVIDALENDLKEFYDPDATWWQLENSILKKLKGKL